jgi:nicotinamidase-related amidase
MRTAQTRREPWLVVIDLQHAFATPGSPWYAPASRSAVDAVAGLVPLYGPRVVFTRFVPPREIVGSWQDYYGKWSFAAGTWNSDIWNVIEPWSDRTTISSPTFSKWVPALRTLLGPHPTVVLAGLSTDCCVLATAFAAVDAGAHVRVVSDACASATPALHDAALMMMARRAPQLAIVTAAEERAAAARTYGGRSPSG